MVNTISGCKLCPLGKHERILVATDGSEYSEAAVTQAIALASKCRSTLYVLTVVEVNVEFMGIAPALMERLDKEAKTIIDNVQTKAAEANIECNPLVRHGEQPYKFIVDIAQQEGIDVVVIGTHGKTGLKKLLMGSVAAKTIGYAPCPVLVIPPTALISLKNILVATDGSKYSEAAVKEAINIAQACGSTLTVLCVVKPERPSGYMEEAKSIVEKVKQEAAQAGIDATTEVREGEPYEEIVNVAKEKNIDLIVMGRYGRTGLKRLLMGSVTERVIGHATCGILVIPPG